MTAASLLLLLNEALFVVNVAPIHHRQRLPNGAARLLPGPNSNGSLAQTHSNLKEEIIGLYHLMIKGVAAQVV